MKIMTPARIPLQFVPPPMVPAAMWFNASIAFTEMMIASAQVIGHRTSMILGIVGLPNADECDEFTLMCTEKMTAWSDASTRAMRGWIALNGLFAQNWLADTKPRSIGYYVANANSLSKAAAKLAADVVDPLHVKATANARRLAAKPPGRLGTRSPSTR